MGSLRVTHIGRFPLVDDCSSTNACSIFRFMCDVGNWGEPIPIVMCCCIRILVLGSAHLAQVQGRFFIFSISKKRVEDLLEFSAFTCGELLGFECLFNFLLSCMIWKTG